MRLILGLLLCLVLIDAFGADSFICAVDQSAGFGFDKSTKSWSATTFRTNRRYLFKKVSEEGRAWEVVELGHETATAWCEDDFSKYGILACGGISEFKLNRNSLRFIHVYAYGYWSDDPKEKNPRFVEGDNTPHMEIGTCSPI